MVEENDRGKKRVRESSSVETWTKTNTQASGEQWASRHSPWWSLFLCLHFETRRLHFWDKIWTSKNRKKRLNWKICDSATGGGGGGKGGIGRAEGQIWRPGGWGRLSMSKSKMEANGRLVPAGVMLRNYALLGFFYFLGPALVWLQRLGAALQPPDGRLISFDKALIGRTVCRSCRFDRVSLLTRWTCRGSALGKNGGEEKCEEAWVGGPVVRSGVQSWKCVTCLVWHEVFFGVSKDTPPPPTLLALPLFCHPPPPPNWI